MATTRDLQSIREGHAADDPIRTALDEARSLTTELRVLGTYPAAER